jgi:hypothetical protein
VVVADDLVASEEDDDDEKAVRLFEHRHQNLHRLHPVGLTVWTWSPEKENR